MLQVLKKYNCGFAGCAVIGLSYVNDWRSHQQDVEFWENMVEPECVIPGSTEWERYVLHNAANIYHVQHKYKIDPNLPVAYKVAWVGGCVMYDTRGRRLQFLGHITRKSLRGRCAGTATRDEKIRWLWCFTKWCLSPGD